MASNKFQAKKASARYNANIVSAVDLEPAEGPILTGVGFLDHMLDQFNSHAQIGLSVVISDFAAAMVNQQQHDTDNKNDDHHHDVVDGDAVDMHQNRNRHAHHDQAKLLSLVGAKVGAEFHRLLVNRGRCGHFDSKKNASIGGTSSSRFVCPLDESLVACTLSPVVATHAGTLLLYTLPPYGKFPSSTTSSGGGRTKLGQLQTAHLETFWSSLAAHAHIDIAFEKLSGDNGHHIVEASFKAMARGLRNLLDGTNTTITTATTTTTANSSSSNCFTTTNLTSTATSSLQQQELAALDALYGRKSENYRQSMALNRQASICRKTKETNIQVTLNMHDGGAAGGASSGSSGDVIQQHQQQQVVADTGIRILDRFLLDLFRATEYMSATIKCQDGDLHIDEHHSVEDVAITLGQVLHETLGTKAGLNRMWCATAERNGNCKVEVVLDLSNRPMLCCHDLAFMQEHAQAGQEHPEEMVGDLPIELIPHFLESFIVQAHLTCHIRQIHNYENSATATPASTQDLLYCIATALGTALRYCCMVDSRRAGATASSKGTLST
jgi:imidazoleglycerol-phosphate dehydratase